MSASTLHRFFVYAPDNKVEGTFERRLSVRSKHMDDVPGQVKSGYLRMAGAVLSPESIDGGRIKMIGSVMIIEAASVKEARAKLQEDIYFKAGVWNPDALIILPFDEADLSVYE